MWLRGDRPRPWGMGASGDKRSISKTGEASCAPGESKDALDHGAACIKSSKHNVA
jgi:hypothetical protein